MLKKFENKSCLFFFYEYVDRLWNGYWLVKIIVRVNLKKICPGHISVQNQKEGNKKLYLTFFLLENKRYYLEKYVSVCFPYNGSQLWLPYICFCFFPCSTEVRKSYRFVMTFSTKNTVMHTFNL